MKTKQFIFFSVDPIKIVTFLEIIRVFSPISGRGQDIHKLRFISNFRTDFCARNEMKLIAASHQNSSKKHKSIRRFNSLYLCKLTISKHPCCSHENQ